MKNLLLLLILVLFIFQTARAERIDGPANIRTAPNKDVFMTLYDNVEVECTPPENEWFQIKINIRISGQQYKTRAGIKKGQALVTLEGDTIGVALVDIPPEQTSHWTSGPETYAMEIYGYTYKNNIRPNSIPENPLINLINLNRNNLTFDLFENYLNEFQFEDPGFLAHPSLKEYMIYENSITDPSPLDRLRMVFQKDYLIAIIHSRPFKIANTEDYSLENGRTITIIKLPTGIDKKTFIQMNKEVYMGID